MSNYKVLRRTPSGFVGSSVLTGDHPVVAVIDPENDEEFDRLYRTFYHHWRKAKVSTPDALRQALREYANPRPMCSASVNIAGEHFGCIEPEGHGAAHHNPDAQAVWGGEDR